jgi:integrase
MEDDIRSKMKGRNALYHSGLVGDQKSPPSGPSRRSRRKGRSAPTCSIDPDGSPIKDFRKAWETACEKAGYPGKLFHDFRRSAVRTLERSGVPRSTAMAMVGHKTESIYRRYAIVDEQMHREAAAKLDAWADDQKAKAKAERKGQVKRFRKRQAS